MVNPKESAYTIFLPVDALYTKTNTYKSTQERISKFVEKWQQDLQDSTEYDLLYVATTLQDSDDHDNKDNNKSKKENSMQ